MRILIQLSKEIQLKLLKTISIADLKNGYNRNLFQNNNFLNYALVTLTYLRHMDCQRYTRITFLVE